MLANGVRLEYIDWGGTGAHIIFIHGIGDNPHIFNDLAPAFTSSHHVCAYARRSAGRSQKQAPYDVSTITEDLRCLIDTAGIAQATLVGWSMGGTEITAMASQHPDRVRSLIYFDAGYDYADPQFKEALTAIPSELLDTPPSAMVSFDAYRAYAKSMQFASLKDMKVVERYLRENVVVQSDGSLTPRITKQTMRELTDALLSNPPRDYARVRVPTLALYATSLFDPRIADPELCAEALRWQQRYWIAFQSKSVKRISEEIERAEVLYVPGAHDSFFLTNREFVVEAMERFLAN